MAFGASLQAATMPVTANITADTIWTSDNTYILETQVYVIDASLTIEAGTVIKGASLEEGAAALIVTRGAKIYALGSPSAPIIFTAEADPLDGSLDETNTALWGGVIILGAAPLNSESNGSVGNPAGTPPTATVDNIEGLANSPDNDWTEFGGLDPDDNSGIFRYVSIRHGGSVIGANNEINGLTMGGVGRGTLVEFVEVFANKDDGFEWFGGTVNARFLVAAFGNDDSFDYDLGWTGKGQFWFMIGTTGATSDAQDHGGEFDGTVDFAVETGPRGMGTIYNATFIGPGAATENEGAFEISDDAGARFYNSIIAEWGNHGIDVLADAADGLTETEGGVTRIDFRNNIWWELGVANAAGTLATTPAAIDFLTAVGKGNTTQDPLLRGVSRTDDAGLDPRPAANSPAWTNARKTLPAGDAWYIDVPFQGAFGETNWMAGWTKLSQDGYLPAQEMTPFTAPVALSCVSYVQASNFTNVGIQIDGDLPRMFIIRALGEKLQDSGVQDPLPDPELIITDFTTQTDVYFETQWLDREDALETLGASVGLATLGAEDGRPTVDENAAAMMVSLNPGIYVIKMQDEDGAAGTGQIEVYMTDL